MGKAIEIKKLVKRYKDVVAVDGIDLDVNDGELFSLLGENGAGKSTTIKILCTLIGFDSGEIKICKNDIVCDRAEIKKIINLSPQETAVAGNLTVRENLELTCDIYGIINSEEKVNEYMNKFSLVEVKDKRAKTLSGGMQRRLSLAMALITSPKVLFLDEPTLGLDVRARRELWKNIKELKGKITILLTTHYIEEAEALSDRLAIMKKGKIIVVGTAEEIKRTAGKDNIEEAFLELIGAEI